MKRINVANGLQFSFEPNLDGENMIWVSLYGNSYEGWTMKEKETLINDLKKAIKVIRGWK